MTAPARLPQTPSARLPQTPSAHPAVPWYLPSTLVLLAMPLLRPNLLGEQLALAGFALVVAAAVVAVLFRGRSQGELFPVGRAWLLVGFLGLAYVWILLRVAHNGTALRIPLQDVLLTVGAPTAVAMVCRDRRAARWLFRGFLVVMLAMCVSYLVTAVMWAGLGTGAGRLATVPVGYVHQPQPLYFPLTFGYSQQAVLGIDLPRFGGLARESGWMAMYCAAAWFMAPMVGFRRRWVRPLLLLGLLGALSTAGFGVFVVVWAYDRFLRPRGDGITLRGYLRQLLGLGAIGLAAWLAVAAPVLGLAAKRTQNQGSLDQRNTATEEGWRALTTHPWGGTGSANQAGVNLVSDVAVNGLPFVLLVLAAFVVPMLRRTAGRSGSVLAVLALTLLLAQPAAGSSWVFCLAVAVLAVDDHPLTADPTAEHPAAPAAPTREVIHEPA